jgi:hypothetical protein
MDIHRVVMFFNIYFIVIENNLFKITFHFCCIWKMLCVFCPEKREVILYE